MVYTQIVAIHSLTQTLQPLQNNFWWKWNVLMYVNQLEHGKYECFVDNKCRQSTIQQILCYGIGTRVLNTVLAMVFAASFTFPKDLGHFPYQNARKIIYQANCIVFLHCTLTLLWFSWVFQTPEGVNLSNFIIELHIYCAEVCEGLGSEKTPENQ